MGDRYHLTVKCPRCGTKDDDAYYAPTCGFVYWHCPVCKYQVDLEEYTGITYEDCSNKEIIQQLCDGGMGGSREEEKDDT